MENVFLEIARKSLVLPNEVFQSSYHAHRKPVKSFQDLRIAGLQGVIDYILSDMGEKYAPSIDVTEFFRIGEPFVIGYNLVQETVGPSLCNKMCEKDSLEGLAHLLRDYGSVLNMERNNRLLNKLEELADKGMETSFQLANGTYLNPELGVGLFKDKKVIVTGSDTGIGRAVGLEFLRRGAKVALHYPTDEFERGAKSVVDLAQEYGKKAEAFQGDFRDKSQILNFSDRAIGYLGGVDIVINNAGITMNKAFEDVIPEQFDSLMNVNLGGVFFVTQRAVPHMKKQGKGVIVNISSIHGLNGMAGHSVYAATKAGVISLTREFAVELSPEIRVNAIAPGWVATANHFRLMPELNFGEVGNNDTIAGFICNPRNMAKHVAWLASDESNYINGQTIPVDGGKIAGMYGGRECTNVGDKPWGRGYVEGV